MPKISVQASIDIATPIQHVQAALIDFHTWPIWSPWLYMEPEATVTYSGSKGELNHGYDWTGKKVGSGGMTLTKNTTKRIECDLQFLKPFKSQADVAFDLEQTGNDATRVTWYMKSALPFFMFWMKGTMSGMIRSDYRRGLAMLKDHLESDQIPSSVSRAEIASVDSLNFVGSHGTIEMSQISESMGASFSALADLADSQSIDITGAPFCIYNRMDIKRDECEYTAAMPTAGKLSIAPPFIADTLPACQALKLVHTGAYRHLGNAWYALISEARFQKLKVKKQVPPFEIYLNDPDTTAEQNLITELYLPLRD